MKYTIVWFESNDGMLMPFIKRCKNVNDMLDFRSQLIEDGVEHFHTFSV